MSWVRYHPLDTRDKNKSLHQKTRSRLTVSASPRAFTTNNDDAATVLVCDPRQTRDVETLACILLVLSQGRVCRKNKVSLKMLQQQQNKGALAMASGLFDHENILLECLSFTSHQTGAASTQGFESLRNPKNQNHKTKAFCSTHLSRFREGLDKILPLAFVLSASKQKRERNSC